MLKIKRTPLISSRSVYKAKVNCNLPSVRVSAEAARPTKSRPNAMKIRHFILPMLCPDQPSAKNVCKGACVVNLFDAALCYQQR